MYDLQYYRITQDGLGRFYVERREPFCGDFRQVNFEPFRTIQEAEHFVASLQRSVVREIK